MRAERLGPRQSTIRHPYRTGLVVTLGALTAIAAWNLLAQVAVIVWCIGVAVLLATSLDPIVGALERRRMRRGPAITVVCAGVMVVVAGAVLLVIPPVVDQTTQLMARADDLAESGAIEAVAGRLQPFVPIGVLDVSETLTQLVDDLASGVTMQSLSSGTADVVVTVADVVLATSVVLVLTVYFLARKRWFLGQLLVLVPHDYRRPSLRIVRRIGERVSRFVLGLGALALLNGVLSLIVLIATGSALPLLFAALALLSTLVPLVGIAVGAVVTVSAQAMMAPDDVARWVILAAWYALYMFVEAYVVAPRVIGRAVALPDVVILVVTLVGATLGGILGALLAVPIAVAAGVTHREITAQVRTTRAARPVG